MSGLTESLCSPLLSVTQARGLAPVSSPASAATAELVCSSWNCSSANVGTSTQASAAARSRRSYSSALVDNDR